MAPAPRVLPPWPARVGPGQLCFGNGQQHATTVGGGLWKQKDLILSHGRAVLARHRLERERDARRLGAWTGLMEHF